MRIENQCALDKLSNREKLLPTFNKILFLLLIVGLTYLAYFSKAPTSNVVSKTEETGLFKAAASARGGRTFCSIELKNGQLTTLACPSRLYFTGEEIKLDKITTETVTYYEVQDEVLSKLNTLTHHSSGTPNGAP